MDQKQNTENKTKQGIVWFKDKKVILSEPELPNFNLSLIIL